MPRIPTSSPAGASVRASHNVTRPPFAVTANRRPSGLKDPRSPEALAVIERVEALIPGGGGHRAQLAERIQAFTDRRTLRY
jgi:hypothetical protein